MAFAHIPMYLVLGVKPTYIRKKGFKSHVQQIMSVFMDDLGNIKGTKIVHGVQRVCRGTGEGHTSVVKSAITVGVKGGENSSECRESWSACFSIKGASKSMIKFQFHEIGQK